MISSSEPMGFDEGTFITMDNKTKNQWWDIPCHYDEYEERPSTVQDLKDQLLVLEEKIVWVLTRADDTQRYIEDLIGHDQIEEIQKRVASGVTSVKFHIIKEALDKMKSDYLQLFIDRDLYLKFV